VVKPLAKQLKGIALFAGSTVMGDGRVALILDVLGLAHKTGVVSDIGLRNLIQEQEETIKKVDLTVLLLLKNYDGGRMAIELSSVSRLEEFNHSDVEFIGNQQMVKYRNQILPLIHIKEVLPDRRRKDRIDENAKQESRKTMHVIVYNKNNRCVGLVIDQILDIVEEDISIRRPKTRDGVLFTTIIQDRVTEFLDVEAIIGLMGSNVFDNYEVVA
jgi:two-component system, chemotaxis family, sensor kinase CheA